MNVSPAFERFARNVIRRTATQPPDIRIRLVADGKVGVASQPPYSADSDFLYETEGLRLFVEQELGHQLHDWTLDATDSINSTATYSVERPGPQSTASNPGRLKLDRELVCNVQKELAGISGEKWKQRDKRFHEDKYEGSFEYIAWRVRCGDTRAAIVMQTKPHLLVAAYSDDFDAILALKFPRELVEKHQLYDGMKLLTCNSYDRVQSGKVADDIDPGPDSSGYWSNFHPVIAQFVSSHTDRLQELAHRISESEWNRCRECADNWLIRHNKGQVKPRIGAPLWAEHPSTQPPMVDAPLRQRAIAAVLDLTLMTVLVAAFFWFFLGFDVVAKNHFANPGANGVGRAEFRQVGGQIRNWASLAFVIYSVAMLMSPLKATIGKLLFGMQVVDVKTRGSLGLLSATMRTCGILIGALFAIKEILDSSSGQAWHDEVANSRVVQAYRPL